MKLKRNLPKYVHSKGVKLSGALEEFSITSQFLAQKCKIQIFEENKGFECSFFFELKYRWYQTRLADLKKTPSPWIFLMNDFLWFF